MISNVSDMYRDRLLPKFPTIPWDQLPLPTVPMTGFPQQVIPQVTREEFDALRKEVVEMKEMLKRAKAFDEANGSPNCETEEKMDLLRKIAALVGIDLDDVIGPKPAGQGA